MVKIKAVNIEAYDDLITEEMYNDVLNESMNRIKYLIQKAGVSNPTLVDEMQIDSGNLSRLMNGSRKLSFRMILKFAKYFNVPLSSIVPDPNEEFFDDSYKYSIEFIEIMNGCSEEEIEGALEILRTYKKVITKHS